MKIYKATAQVYHYWKNFCESGDVEEVMYFASKELAEKWCDGKKGLWCNRDGKMVPVTETYQEPTFEIEEIDVIEKF